MQRRKKNIKKSSYAGDDIKKITSAFYNNPDAHDGTEYFLFPEPPSNFASKREQKKSGDSNSN